MATLPEIVSRAWDEKEGPVIFTTVDREGIPNAIYATCVAKYDEQTIIVAHNYFTKTFENIKTNGHGSILFITGEGKAYQLKGSVSLHTEGPYFDDMKRWNPEKHPGHAAAVLQVEAIYSGAERLD